MPYQMYRVFCATPSDAEADLEAERHAFHNVVGDLNEAEAMADGVLFVPVSVLPNMTSLIVYQKSVDENVRACRFFVQVLDHTWGPATRNFEPQYQLATQCCAGVSLFFKAPNGRPVEPAVSQLRESLLAAQASRVIDFENLDDFKTRLRSQLSAWLQSIKTD